MSDKISLNEMRDQAGRLIFGDDWIGGLTDEEHELRREHLPRREIQRANGSCVELEHAKPLSAQIALEVDRVLGKAVRLQAQYVTVDTWLQENGMLRAVEVIEIEIDGKTIRKTIQGDREAFSELMRSEAAKQAPAEQAPEPLPEEMPGQAPPARGPGREAKILPRVKAAMEKDLRDGEITREQLEDTPYKELEDRYGAERERFGPLLCW
jgi:hypothetical protein